MVCSAVARIEEIKVGNICESIENLVRVGVQPGKSIHATNGCQPQPVIRQGEIENSSDSFIVGARVVGVHGELFDGPCLPVEYEDEGMVWVLKTVLPREVSVVTIGWVMIRGFFTPHSLLNDVSASRESLATLKTLTCVDAPSSLQNTWLTNRPSVEKPYPPTHEPMNEAAYSLSTVSLHPPSVSTA